MGFIHERKIMKKQFKYELFNFVRHINLLTNTL